MFPRFAEVVVVSNHPSLRTVTLEPEVLEITIREKGTVWLACISRLDAEE